MKSLSITRNLRQDPNTSKAKGSHVTFQTTVLDQLRKVSSFIDKDRNCGKRPRKTGHHRQRSQTIRHYDVYEKAAHLSYKLSSPYFHQIQEVDQDFARNLKLRIFCGGVDPDRHYINNYV